MTTTDSAPAAASLPTIEVSRDSDFGDWTLILRSPNGDFLAAGAGFYLRQALQALTNQVGDRGAERLVDPNISAPL